MNSAPQIQGWRHTYRGKVRDLYVPETGAADTVLIVASDRISAFDYVLDSTIPDKGAILTALSLWWFEQLADVVPNHILSTEVPAAVAGRAMICRVMHMYPVECIARGYLEGNGLLEYREHGSICGIELPEGLQQGSAVPEPIFTPTTKAELGRHDENMSFEQVVTAVGANAAAKLRELTVACYRRGHDIARERGIILADTKFEFGQGNPDDPQQQFVLADEVLTPDSSRFWPADQWEPGGPQPSFDKQFVREWLTCPQSEWDRSAGTPPPPLPEQIVARTRDRYLEAYQRLTGHSWQ